MTLNRRHFLGASSAMMLLGACSGSKPAATEAAPAALKSIDKVGIQTYTLREAMGEDFVGTLQMIKDVGYDYVELNRRDFSEKTPAEVRAILNDIGLPSPITHGDYDSLRDRPEEWAEIAAALEAEYVILPWLNDDQRGLDDFKAHADMLNRAGEVLKPAGVKVGFHNHQFEFFDLGDGQTGMETLLQGTDPDLVHFELDLFWAALAGADIVDLFKAHPGRFKMCHVKDLKGDASGFETSMDFAAIVPQFMANVGEGDLPFETYFAASEVAGLEYFIAEHDNPPRPFRESVKTSHDSIRAMRF